MSTSYILIDYNMAPDVFKKVIEVKKMLASGKLKSVGKALDDIDRKLGPREEQTVRPGEKE